MKSLNQNWPFFLTLSMLTVAGLTIPQIFGAYWVIVALNLAMWIALTQSWSLFSGMTGYISLGHVVFYGIGAYVVAATFNSVPLYISVPMAGLISAFFALVVALPVLRVRGPYFVILTFGLAELVKFIILNFETAIGKSSRLLFGAPKTETILYLMIGLAFAASLATHYVKVSRFGRGLTAIQDDETSAETIGVPVVRYKVIAFAASAAIPGMVGGLMALRSTYFEVLQVFNPIVSFTIVTMAIIGGRGDARGPLFGAAFLVALSELLWANAPRLYMIFLGFFLVGFVVLAPNGIVGLLKRSVTGEAK